MKALDIYIRRYILQC